MAKNLHLLAAVLMVPLYMAIAQSSTDSLPAQKKNASEWVGVDERPPEYPGGMKALSDFLRQHLLYPNEAKKANVQGRVFVSFVIDTLGQVGQIRVLKGLGHGCDEEAIRVMEQMPCWIPGELNGRKVQVKYNLPIMFPQDH